MVVTCVWVVLVERFVRVLESAMIGPVLDSPTEAIFMGAFVSSRQVPMNVPVLGVIAGVAVVNVVRDRRRKRCSH